MCLAPICFLFTTVLCICAEQTFNEAMKKEQDFRPAFTIALDAYVNSAVGDNVNQAVDALLKGRAGDDLNRDRIFSEELDDIIYNHRLRMF